MRMRRITYHKPIVALVTAYALVLQALLAGFAFGAYAQLSKQQIVFELCQSHTAGSPSQDAPGKPAEPGHMGCCVLCWVPSLDPSDLAGVAFDFPQSAKIGITLVWAPSEGTFAFDWLPGRPRGPPQRLV